MELREPILAAQKARLAEVLETPSLTGATRQNLGWVNLNEENADWSLCAYAQLVPQEGDIDDEPWQQPLKKPHDGSSGSKT